MPIHRRLCPNNRVDTITILNKIEPEIMQQIKKSQPCAASNLLISMRKNIARRLFTSIAAVSARNHNQLIQ